jgi:hypothetical protein
LLRDKEIEIMKRITLVLGVVAVMVAMLVALAAPAMAKDNGGNHNNGGGINRVDNDLGRLDNGLDNRADLDQGNFFEPPIPPVVPEVVPPVPPVITEPVDTAMVEPGDTLFGIAQEQLGPAAPPSSSPTRSIGSTTSTEMLSGTTRT